MTTFAALIPRVRYRTGRVVAIRCPSCRSWRDPRRFTRRSNTCHGCSYGGASRRIAARAHRRG
jgi:uncharacterized C2H2 Zn-finger protein